MHRKQFVIGPASALSRHQWPERFKSVLLPHGLEVRYCPDRKLSRSTDGNVVLIGDVVEADSLKPSPSHAIERLTDENLADVTETWTGHWCLVVRGNLYVDFLGLMSIYRPRESTLDAAGSFVVSSSPALLIDFYKLAPVHQAREFQPVPIPPWCFHPGLMTLLAGEYIKLVSGKTEIMAAPPLEVYDVSPEEIRIEVKALLLGAMRALGKQSNVPVLSALTAGYDSRLNFAAAKAVDCDFEAFTFVKSYFFTPDADRILPPKLARQFGVKHHLIRSDSFSSSRAHDYIMHAGGEVSTYPGNGYSHYSEGYWDKLGHGKTCLDGLCFELAVNYHNIRLSRDFDLKELLANGFFSTDQDFAYTSRHWEQVRKNSFPFDRRDLVFWTANCNGAYARVIQKHDLFADIFISACNRRQMNLLMSVPVADRDRCQFEATITKSMLAAIDSLPYNPPEPIHKRAYKKARKIFLTRIQKIRSIFFSE